MENKIPPDVREWLVVLHATAHNTALGYRIVQHFSDIHDILRAPRKVLIGLGLSSGVCQSLLKPDWARIDQTLGWLKKQRVIPLTWADPAYPVLLREITDPPIFLMVKGDAGLLSRPQLAIVGSRHGTIAAREIARSLAAELSLRGVVITSGMALGIDAAAHQGALEVDAPTIAVFGTSLDSIYPLRHQALAERIQQSGAYISEFPLGTPPSPRNFPRRNRIISGLSLGTLVVEANLKSGSLVTARLANEQGREVFAVPSSIRNVFARGCHALLRDGAKLVETVSDILEELPVNFQPNETSARTVSGEGLDAPHRKLLECIGFEMAPIDLLLKRSGFLPAKVATMLISLEQKGHIVSVPGGYVRV